ncbi:hypothetical protein TSTA_107130 [Talaromyces stipitatus ATCC 10500]|uniref:DUF6570 domain-containing protein n=1 Tax=Talaromyces stipitatus (strain ATCC 10500 / CBS 375.48 / QM 6759 / NRRL 1006) TaxID=441959 RepID=B8MN56_TALSN|nr:uncharacterized protein TSTA_107130 [Talaromyces stipitatus ATCC 10500]EED14505.1 hypothetical protein TSTA_107130 [Talaromyces stipitatus ATCC 10500]
MTDDDAHDSETYCLDLCALRDHRYWFCTSCYNAIQRDVPPKYSALNDVDVTFCQQYPEALEGLTLTEELLISRCRPIASIVKLRPNAVRSPVAYNRLRGHVVVLPQDPGPLLDILPSDSLRLHDRIKVVWFGKNAPAVDDLKPYLEVRKHVVYTALLWLCNHNKLYSSIVINSDAQDSWPDSFIPQTLLDAMVHTDDDSHEREGYAFGSAAEGLENDFHQALPDEIPDHIGSGCVYTDLESERQRPTLHLISTVMDLERERLQSAATVTEASIGGLPRYIDDVPVIRYSSNGRLVLMNDWQDADYFTGAFPTLFPYGVGGHISNSELRPVSVSLKAWAKWALSHHSRRFT